MHAKPTNNFFLYFPTIPCISASQAKEKTEMQSKRSKFPRQTITNQGTSNITLPVSLGVISSAITTTSLKEVNDQLEQLEERPRALKAHSGHLVEGAGLRYSIKMDANPLLSPLSPVQDAR